MKIRSDLIAIPRDIMGETFWIIKDPVRLNYFHYPDPAFFVLDSLKQGQSLQEIQRRYQQRFGESLGDQRLARLLSDFARDELLLWEQGQDGSRLAATGRQQQQRNRWAWLKQPLAIRLPGWNFTRIFQHLKPLADVVVRPATLVVILLGLIAACLIVATQWDGFRSRLPTAQEFFRSQNLLLILACLGITKILHELGHALSCRKLGAECHEIGVMFLLLTPCLYCDVSDAWMISSKWKRIVIAASGILVELLVASLATLVWWFSEPGFLNNVCLNLMVICGVSTVLFNGNPLLRYDGYFIFSDLVGIPNLYSRSRNHLAYLANRWILGIEIPGLREEQRRGTLIGYGISSLVYRILLVGLIVYWLVSYLISWRLEIVALLLLIVAVTGLIVMPMGRQLRRLISLTYHHQLPPVRLGGILAGLLVLVLLVVAVPLPRHVTVDGYLEFADAQRVYVNTPGLLENYQAYGKPVSRGMRICELVNPDLAASQAKLQGELLRNEQRLKQLEALRALQTVDGDEIPGQRERIATLRESHRNLAERIAGLSVVAERAGVLIPPRRRSPPTHEASETLPFWTDQPLATRNLGAYLEQGELVALVGQPRRLEAFLLVRQENIDLIRSGQKAQVRIAETPSRSVTGTVESLTVLRESELPPDVREVLKARFGKVIQASELESGRIYLANLRLESEIEAFQFESARARIRVDSAPLASRVARYLRQTFASLFQ